MIPLRPTNSRTIRNVMFDRPVETLSRKDRRQQRKRALWCIDPRCHDCGRRLTIEAAHLVNDALTCADCEQTIRDREAEKQNRLYRTIQNRDDMPENVQLELTLKAKRWLAARQARADQLKNRDRKNKLRREMVEAGHRCDCCRRELSTNAADPNYAHLVMGQKLSCAEHVQIVAQLCRMAAVSEQVEIQSKPDRCPVAASVSGNSIPSMKAEQMNLTMTDDNGKSDDRDDRCYVDVFQQLILNREYRPAAAMFIGHFVALRNIIAAKLVTDDPMFGAGGTIEALEENLGEMYKFAEMSAEIAERQSPDQMSDQIRMLDMINVRLLADAKISDDHMYAVMAIAPSLCLDSEADFNGSVAWLIGGIQI